MSDRLLDEGIELVVEAAALEGVSISPKTALRWCLQGVRGVRLENLKVRGRRMTSRAALRRFIASTQDRQAPVQACIDPEGARRVLEAYGL
ncbi:MAG: DUF1580 domain-containing protein [Planctomycetes bacterium]|nr:DUF1580 domain-containing protein [Planctomycetota bacterium]